MKLKLGLLLTIGAVLALALMFASCDNSTDTPEGDNDVAEAEDGSTTDEVAADMSSEDGPSVGDEKALKTKVFYISNYYNGKPHKSKAVKFTATIASGSLAYLGLFDDYVNPPIELIRIKTCTGKTCTYSKSLSCKNYGTMEVWVEYTGTVAPRLTYWFTDC